MRDKLIHRAQTGARESKNLDFKVGFDLTSREAWCEVLKDIIAMANSGGGVIVFGINDDGSPAGVDVDPYLRIDPASITDKVNSYTTIQFSDFEIIEVVKEGTRVAAMLVYAVDTPMVFTANGSHQVQGAERRPAFVKGSVYFRHGAKSEPGNTNDLRSWLDRSLEEVRKTWLGGIRQVVEMQRNDVLQILPPGNNQQVPVAQIGNGPDAQRFVPQNPEEIWPHRQTEVIARVRAVLGNGVRFTSHDIQCIKEMHDITMLSRPEFIFKSHPRSSPQYSQQFIDWVTTEIRRDPNFLIAARQRQRTQ